MIEITYNNQTINIPIYDLEKLIDKHLKGIIHIKEMKFKDKILNIEQMLQKF